MNLRHYKSYETVLLWCKIFLKKQSFLPYFGKENAFALLFDMNKLFESFVAKHLKQCLIDKEYQIKTQEKSQFLLCSESKNFFPIKPDIVCKDKDKTLFIADTKWKIISSFDDISQADLYQIFAYLAKYECERGILIYPKIKGEKKDGENTEQEFKKEFSYKATLLDGKTYKVKICFFDVSDDEKAQKSALEIHKEILRD